MRIIKTPEGILAEKKKREMANSGCHRCPCCGEEKTTNDYLQLCLRTGELKGITSVHLCREFDEGLFKIKVMSVDWYKCYSCGAEWESEPY